MIMEARTEKGDRTVKSLLSDEKREQRNLPEPRLCRCFAPPLGMPFEKGGLYSWEYGIDCIFAYHESGFVWRDGEIQFAARFQILRGKCCER